jgi:hypothetical protein
MINLETAAEHFKDHVATFKDYGDIKILDFKKPESQSYHIRFTFDESCGYCHIDGDLGFLTAVRRGGMTYEGFTAYVNSPSYFEEKVVCHNRPFYEYDYDDARKEIKEYLKENNYDPETTFDFEDKEELFDEKLDIIMTDFDDERGLSPEGWNELCEIVQDAWEVAGDFGKKRIGIVELYLLAFSLAKAQIEMVTDDKAQRKEEHI